MSDKLPNLRMTRDSGITQSEELIFSRQLSYIVGETVTGKPPMFAIVIAPPEGKDVAFPVASRDEADIVIRGLRAARDATFPHEATN